MAARKLMAKVGSYEKDGQTKGRYVNVGVMLSSEHGDYILLDPTVSISGCLAQQNRVNHAAGKKLGDKLMVNIFDD